MMSTGREGLFIGGIFGCVIGSLFMFFGQMGNFLCEMMFWSFVLYVVMIYFEIVPNVIRSVMKKHVFFAQCMMSLAWVPLVVGGAIVVFLGSLLFVDYSAVELSCLLRTAKVILMALVLGSGFIVFVRQLDKVRLIW